jgi:hypothetical protein
MWSRSGVFLFLEIGDSLIALKSILDIFNGGGISMTLDNSIVRVNSGTVTIGRIIWIMVEDFTSPI